MTVEIKETDLTTWQPAEGIQAIGRVLRKRPTPKLKRVGKYWTIDIANPTIPRAWLFKQRRLAKKFFAGPVIVSSNARMCSIYGSPDRPFRSAFRTTLPEYEILGTTTGRVYCTRENESNVPKSESDV